MSGGGGGTGIATSSLVPEALNSSVMRLRVRVRAGVRVRTLACIVNVRIYNYQRTLTLTLTLMQASVRTVMPVCSVTLSLMTLLLSAYGTREDFASTVPPPHQLYYTRYTQLSRTLSP